jgi:hypothetical protein
MGGGQLPLFINLNKLKLKTKNMKKLILSIALFATTTIAYSQTFNGVSISGNTQSVVDSFKARGFKFVDSSENTVVMKGEVTGKPFELYIITTPKSKQVCKVAGYFDEIDSWYGLEAEYNSIINIITQKYNKPDNKYAFFTKPYYKGDGYELQALGVDKVSYSSYWFNKDNLNICVSISKFKMVKVDYENSALMEVNTKEKAELAKKVF